MKNSVLSNRLLRVFMSIFAMMLCLSVIVAPSSLGVTNTLIASANNDDGLEEEDKDSATIKVEKAFTYEEFIEKYSEDDFYAFPEKYGDLKEDNESQYLLKRNFKNSGEYAKWIKSAKEAIISQSSSDGSSSTISLGMEPKNAGDYDVDSQQWTKAWAKYNSVVNKFNKIMTRVAYNSLTNDVFGDDFNPTNAITLAFQESLSMACNTIFNLAAQMLMLFFLVQTAFDALYLTIPALQPVLGPANSSSAPGGGGAGVAKGGAFKIQFNLVSNEAVDAANRSSTGTTGGAGSGSILETVIALKYIVNRAPTFLLAASYIVLAVTGIWPKMISAVSAFVAQIFNALV